MKPIRKCINSYCQWETDIITKKEDGVCPRCHTGVVKYISENGQMRKDISEASIEDLQAELERRKQLARKPIRFQAFDWNAVIDYVIWSIDKVQEEGVLPKDFEHQLMVCVLTTMYGGSDFWNWWNLKLSGK